MNDQALLRLAVDITTKALARQTMDASTTTELLRSTYRALDIAVHPKPEVEPEVKKRRGRPRKVSSEIVDKAQAKDAMVEQIVTDNFDEMIDENDISEEDNIVGEITADENGEIAIPKRPEPMFED